VESTENAVAIIAILATVVAALGGAIIAAIAAHHRQRKQLGAETRRLRQELDAAYQRQERQLAHDRAVRDEEELVRLERASGGWVTRTFHLLDRLEAAYRDPSPHTLSRRVAPWLVLAALCEEILNAALVLKVSRRHYMRTKQGQVNNDRR
jgi:predicted acylesterase/phospholipase RssA